MPEHQDPAEAVAAAAEAIEKLTEDDKTNKTPSVGPFSDHKLRSLAALILASTSLLATLGTFIKTCDHSVTQNAYETLSQGIQKAQDDQRQNHEDIVAIRSYLEGLSRAPMSASLDAGAVASPIPSTSASSTAPTASSLRPLVRPTTTATAAVSLPNDGGLITFAIQSEQLPPPPPVHSAPPTWQAKPWNDVAAGR